MTEESVNANSRKCVTLRLDPCPLELGREPTTYPFWRDFLNSNRTQKKREFNKTRIFFIFTLGGPRESGLI